MFDPSETPRLFGLPPGIPFAQGLVQGLEERLKGKPPEAWGRVTIFVNTKRMRRALTEALLQGPPRLLPRIYLVSDLSALPQAAAIPPAIPPLRLRLKLAGVLDDLIERTPGLAPKSASLDLAETLAALFDEMQSEGVTLEDLKALTPEDHARHWQRALSIASVLEPFFGAHAEPGREARQRRCAEALINDWTTNPPQDPVLIAGSTGSRGTTRMVIEAATRLPQGAVILPGYDYHQPAHVWAKLDNALTGEDHPQFRFCTLGANLGIENMATLPRWSTATQPANDARARLISLALRPAPVTDHWITEGRAFADLPEATKSMRLLLAPSERAEALAIAAAMRAAHHNGQTATLVTPDRTLGRRVTAALERWNILPDDSVGQPLHLTAAGRFLCHLTDWVGRPLTLEGLITLTKHPLTNSTKEDRGPHLKATRELEIYLRRKGILEPTGTDIAAWADRAKPPEGWVDWLTACITALTAPAPETLSTHISNLHRLAQDWAAGPAGTDTGELWRNEAGEKARATLTALEGEAMHSTAMLAPTFRQLLKSELSAQEVMSTAIPHASIRILGTLEARVGTDDLVILGGLNEGTWPGAPAPDPWMNRQMRQEAGLLLPERRIGLAAHDFQQAAAASRVILSRALRNAEAETIPSRWLSRLTNLISGMGEAGRGRLEEMQAEGAALLNITEALEAPRPQDIHPPAPRPAPVPPLDLRPDTLSVTGVRTLIRDPYAIYASRILRLYPLPSLVPEPDARLRGIILHDVLEKGLIPGFSPETGDPEGRLLALAEQALTQLVPWPYTRLAWQARMEMLVPKILKGEAKRHAEGRIHTVEAKAEMAVTEAGFTLTGRADRIDADPTGTFTIFDYKSTIPTKDQMAMYDIQLPLQAAMLERGGFEGIAKGSVGAVGYIGLDTDAKVRNIALEGGKDGLADQTWSKFLGLLAAYKDPATGYRAFDRVAPNELRSDYAQLARFGEWDLTTPATPQKVGP
ncbi:double-strand break repair protein AddB [Alphaproteobacteria bacterium KMM 3653]|uniref:Double-strand break repair protein AddB n=1 Tax=Harenicola maris TaxID=2841044 RepID=A0AAP2CPI8_9RHOB|nr:double-strand break repair protein AddB [Harenicola maris]